MSKYFYLTGLLTIIFSACSSPTQEGYKLIAKSDEFPKCIDIISTEIVPQVDIIPLGMVLDGDTVVVRSNHCGRMYYRFRLEDWTVIDSFGIKGQGPAEMINPFLMVKSHDNYLFLDTGRKNLLEWIGDSIIETTIPLIPTQFEPWLRHFPFYATSVNVGGETRHVQINSVDLATPMDTLPVAAPLFAGSTQILFNGALDNLIGIAMSNRNEYLIGEIKQGGIEWTVYRGENDSSTPKLYYSAITIGDDKLFLLSQRKVDMKSRTVKGELPKGFSEIEVYTLAGNPIMCIELDFLATELLLDKKRDMLYTYSLNDDTVHSFQVPKL
ncbi:MAG: TolB-like 6-bladed beta-propeller domain-containing protein [Bacteroidales bacterium]|nr:TolB-like 6-bladed beta-propeller domain-containing protein [Bacteroidales bacterium]